jgi:hypothetical protein
VAGRTISLTIVGFLVGVLAAGGIGVRVIEEVRAEDDATSLPLENVSSPSSPPGGFSIAPHETLIASSAVIPTSVDVSGPSLGIEFGIVTLAPTAGSPTAEFPFLYPESWILTTDSYTVDGGPGSLGASTAHFDLPAGTSSSDIRSVDIVDPVMAYPLDAQFDLSETAPSVTVTERVEAELVSVTKQGDMAAVRIDFSAEDPTDLAFIVEGIGTGWRSASTVEGSSAVELLWGGDDFPAVVTIRVAGIQWIDLVGSYPVLLEGNAQ